MSHLGRIAVILTLIAGLYFAWTPAAPAGSDWQPIDPADLAMKDNPKDPGADAMILYRQTDIDEPLASTTDYTRMKIFTREGIKYGDIQLEYDKSVEKIAGIEGRTIHADGSIVNFDGKTYDKVEERGGGVKILVKSFTLPDVQVGSIIEYRYSRLLDSQKYFIGSREWSPAGELFTRDVKFSVVPLTGYNSELHQLAFREARLPVQVQPVWTGKRYELQLHDIPGVAKEDYMPPVESLEARIGFFYREENEPRDETPEQYWKRENKKFNEAIEHFVDKKKALEEDVQKTVSANDAPDVKLRKIYDRTLQIRNLGMESEKSRQEQHQENLKANSNVEDVLKHGYGWGREINFLFLGLARTAGFDAAEVYVAPANVTLFTPKSQEVSQLSADVVWVKAGGKEYYLDPAMRYYPFGVTPWFESMVSGIRVRKDGPEFVSVPPLDSGASRTVRDADIELNAQGGASGKLTVEFTGVNGAVTRLANRDEDETGRKKVLADRIRGWLPEGSTFEVTNISNWDNVEAPLHIEGTLKIADAGTSAGHRLLMPLALFRSPYSDSFKPAKRVNDIQFSYPFEDVDDVKYHAPQGYKVESLPKVPDMQLKVVTYEIAETQQGDMVEIKRHFAMQGIFYTVKYYEALRAFFSTVKSDDDAQLILENTETAKRN